MAGSDHADKNAKNKAVLSVRSGYRGSGYSHISGDGGRRAVYDNLMKIRRGLRTHKPRPIRPRNKSIEPWSDKHAEGYTFRYFRGDNAGPPYRNQAHHIIPIEFFTAELLGADELTLMRKVDYNINNGANIIFLPQSAAKVGIHGLPTHCGSHPKYTRIVKTEASKMRQSLQKAIDKDKKHTEWSPPDDLPAELKSLQKALWNLIVRMVGIGQESINKLDKGDLAPSASR